ncbi:MAG: sugar phosphate isomerase/epimerase [Spirochaetia bacterium]|nr:sugar phosphate isomerase/epimerase [Spirochaetia bacterium]
MKIGLSTYSLIRAIRAGELDLLSALSWIQENGGEHAEIAYSLLETPALAKDVRKKAGDLGLPLSSYTIGANFIQPDPASLRKEIERVKREVDIGGELGVKRMRHDAASRPIPECGMGQFMKDLPVVADAAREVCDHAKKYGITTSVENHGFFLQKSDRVQLLIAAVGRETFRTTLDVGNFLCADEDPVSAVKSNLPFASHIHFKDFLVRRMPADPGEVFFKTLGGHFLRGTIVGHGDVDVRSAAKLIRESGYAGFVSVEFEGMEECRNGSRISMANLKALLGGVP